MTGLRGDLAGRRVGVLAHEPLEGRARARMRLRQSHDGATPKTHEDDGEEIEGEILRIGRRRELARLDRELHGFHQLPVELYLPADDRVAERPGLVIVFARRRVDGAAP